MKVSRGVRRWAFLLGIAAGFAVRALAQNDTQLRTDWAQLGRYASANAALPVAAPGVPRVVFFGDSITDRWDLAKFFPGKTYLNRGISGQTTTQMLVRFRPDILNLKPQVVVILAGINDLAQNSGPESNEFIEGNFTSMCELARANSVTVVLSSILPVPEYPWGPGLQPGPRIALLNAWLKQYAQAHGLVYLDYYSAMALPTGAMRDGLHTGDGVHPSAAGYAVMTPLADVAIAEALRSRVTP